MFMQMFMQTLYLVILGGGLIFDLLGLQRFFV
jgi:hypothetical protein